MPLNFTKEDSPKKLIAMVGKDPKYFLTNAEFMQIVNFINQLEINIENIDLSGFISLEQLNAAIEGVNNPELNLAYQGSLTPSMPITGTGKAFWFALEPGVYPNAGGVVVNENSLAVISRNDAGTFSITQMEFTIQPNSEAIGVAESEWAGLAGANNPASIHFNEPFLFDGVITEVTIPITEVGTFYFTIANTYTDVTNEQPVRHFVTAATTGNITFQVNIPVTAGQFIGLSMLGSAGLKYKFITGGFVYAFKAVKLKTELALIELLDRKVEDNYAEQQTEVDKKLDQNRLSPCVLYFDNFSTDKNIKKFNLVSGAYVMEDVAAYTNVGWVKSVEDNINYYIRPTTAGNSNNSLKLNHSYTCEYRKHRYMIKLESLDSVIRIQTHNFPVGEGNTLLEYDFPNNKMRFIRFDGDTFYNHTIDFIPEVGKIYWLEVMRLSFAIKISIQEANDLTNYSEYQIGNQINKNDADQSGSGQFEIYLHAGTPFKLYQNSVTTEGKNADVYATGDSIMASINQVNGTNSQRWVQLVKDKVKNMVISSRGTSTFNDVLLRLTSEVEFLRPKILLSANGFNGDVTQAYIDALSNFCEERNIQYIQTMITHPVPKTYGANVLYATQNRQTVRFDIACCNNGDLSLGMNFSDYPDSIHPNANGCIKLANRVFVDIPQLVESFNR